MLREDVMAERERGRCMPAETGNRFHDKDMRKSRKPTRDKDMRKSRKPTRDKPV